MDLNCIIKPMGESEERNFIVLASIHYMYILQDYEISMSNIIQFTIKQLSFACNKILPGSQKLRSHKYFSRKKQVLLYSQKSVTMKQSVISKIPNKSFCHSNFNK